MKIMIYTIQNNSNNEINGRKSNQNVYINLQEKAISSFLAFVLRWLLYPNQIYTRIQLPFSTKSIFQRQNTLNTET